MAGPTLNWPNWLGVVVENLEVQRAFYRDVLGLSELGAGDERCAAAVGDTAAMPLTTCED